MKNTWTLALVVAVIGSFVAGFAIAQGGYVPNARDVIPAQDCEIVTPSDSETIRVTRLLIVGNSGTLKVQFNSGRNLTIPADIVIDGFSAPLVVNKVWQTGTTATTILGCR